MAGLGTDTGGHQQHSGNEWNLLKIERTTSHRKLVTWQHGCSNTIRLEHIGTCE
jgi:hypothetical protein